MALRRNANAQERKLEAFEGVSVLGSGKATVVECTKGQ